MKMLRVDEAPAVFKLAVVGSRTISSNKEAAHVYGVLDGLRQSLPLLTHVVSGGARGPDRFAAQWAKERGVELVEHLPDWTVGKHAGHLRNSLVARDCDAMVAFWDGRSKGTLHAIGCARAMGKRAFVDMMDGKGFREMP